MRLATPHDQRKNPAGPEWTQARRERQRVWTPQRSRQGAGRSVLVTGGRTVRVRSAAVTRCELESLRTSS
jgi:hypothetical protein